MRASQAVAAGHRELRPEFVGHDAMLGGIERHEPAAGVRIVEHTVRAEADALPHRLGQRHPFGKIQMEANPARHAFLPGKLQGLVEARHVHHHAGVRHVPRAEPVDDSVICRSVVPKSSPVTMNAVIFGIGSLEIRSHYI